MNRLAATLCGLALLVLATSQALAQISVGGTPPGLESRSLPAPEHLHFPQPDEQALLAEDEQAGKHAPLRFGFRRQTDLCPLDHGTWQDLPDGSRLWRLALSCERARSTNLVYENFALPAGARMWVYTPDGSRVIGAFTQDNNKPDGVFATSPLPGPDCIVEVQLPPGDPFRLDFRIVGVVQAYRNIFGLARDAARDYNDSGSCNINVNCPSGGDWETERNSVAMILTGGGDRLCSGALINTERDDQTQYLLTAEHCMGGESSFIFMFNYQSPGCGNQDGPTMNTVQGAIRRASHADSDFALLELTEPIPLSYNVSYAGWDRRNIAAPSAVSIHHPNGDIKKISFENDALGHGSWPGSPAGSHWHIADWEGGTTEPGSSGSPLFNPDHRIIGQLSGGAANCSNSVNDYYGKLWMDWDYHSGNNQQLAHWLDPDDTGVETVGGSEAAPTDRPNLVVDDNEPLDPADLLNPGYNAPFVVHVQNTGILATGITGRLRTLDNYITITDSLGSWPDLPNLNGAWNTANPFRFSISPATPLGRLVNLTVVFDTQEGYTATRTFSISVGVREVFVLDDFSTDEGWTLAPGWEIGPAEAGGGQSGGPDPAEDYSPSADNGILGFVIGGDYPNNLAEIRWAESPAYDMTWAAGTNLHFQRWLGVDADFWDHASLQAWDGSAWVELWASQLETYDGDWILRTFDVSEQADGNPAFRVRFGMGTTNGTTTYCGWNIDELELLAFNTLPPVSYDPPLAAAPLREGNDLVLAWQPTTPSPYYRVEWRPSSAPGVDWQVLALCTGTELRIDRGYALLGHSGLFRVVSTDRTNGLVPVLSVPAETLIPR